MKFATAAQENLPVRQIHHPKPLGAVGSGGRQGLPDPLVGGLPLDEERSNQRWHNKPLPSASLSRQWLMAMCGKCARRNARVGMRIKTLAIPALLHCEAVHS